MTRDAAFFTLHRDLPREGPGTAADVLWALEAAGTPEEAAICDAACGPGADTVTLAGARPRARIDAIDLQAHFAEEAARRTARFGPRVTVTRGDYAELPGSYSLIWCSGAVYFTGFTRALAVWKPFLDPGGAIAFNEPVFLTDQPGPGARAFWEDYPKVMPVAALNRGVEAAGWRIEAQRIQTGAAWEAYYMPMEDRIAALRASGPGSALVEVLDAAAREIAHWRTAPGEIAYALQVVRPQ